MGLADARPSQANAQVLPQGLCTKEDGRQALCGRRPRFLERAAATDPQQEEKGWHLQGARDPEAETSVGVGIDEDQTPIGEAGRAREQECILIGRR